MVPRADYLAAVAETKAARVDVDSKTSDLASLEQQLRNAKDQLKSALGDMVPRSELEAAKTMCEHLEAQATKTTAEHSRKLDDASNSLLELQAANEKLTKVIQVRVDRPLLC